jgi:hypothetical protein
MSISRIIGIILLIVGIFCLGFVWSSTHAPLDQVTAVATGRFTQVTMWYLIAGIAMIVGGGALFIGGRPKP